VLAAFQERAAPLAPIGGVPSEWIIASLVLVLWAGIFILFGRRQRKFSKQRNREIAEKLIASLPSELERVRSEATAVAGLRLDELQELTAEFERLGFVQRGDYRITFGKDELTRGFFRLFYQVEKHCFADLGVLRKTLEAGKGPFLYGISSSLEESWGIGTGNSKPSVINYLWRLPKLLQVKNPIASPEELLTIHLELRENIARDLELKIIADPSAENFFARSDNTRRLRKEALLNRDIVKDLSEAKRIEEQGHWEWLGDYPHEAARRAKGKNLRPLMEFSPTYSLPQSDALDEMDAAKDTGPTDKSNG
jgi:hypothetical protein